VEHVSEDAGRLLGTIARHGSRRVRLQQAATEWRRPGIGISGRPIAREIVSLLAFLALFSTYRFPTAEFLETLQRPVLVIHGDADGVIPFARGRALFDHLREPKTFVRVAGGDHNDARPADELTYWGAVVTFIVDLRR
jgi:fermentation-respiration switch protein FrsA (DUF1100 family)